MFDDTIAAISTTPGEGGIGIVRLSGRDAVSIAERLFWSPRGKKLGESDSHKLIYGFIKDPATGAAIDEALVVLMKAPRTYTKEDVVEINCHGGILSVRKILELALSYGARLAEPGEFTKRAFLNGRIDLSQAEAVIDLIRAKTAESGRAALQQLSGGLSEKITSLRDRMASVCAHIEAYIDSPEEELGPASFESILEELRNISTDLQTLSDSFEEGRFLREGLKVAIIGRPNVGKSSLLNALLRRDRAIVTASPGTTRDVIEEYLNLKGLPVRIMDTAGIREAHEMAEKEGVIRSLRAIDDADVVVALVDGTGTLHEEDMSVLDRIREKHSIIAINKSDLPAAENGIDMHLMAYSRNILKISALTGLGLDALKDKISDVSLSRSSRGGSNGVIITNIRHKLAIDHAVGALHNAGGVLQSGHPLEIMALEVREALDKLGEIVGAVTTEEILNRIFSEFCVGK